MPTPAKQLLSHTISEYDGAKSVVGTRTTVGEALARIKGDKPLRIAIGRLRSTKDRKTQEAMKKVLPAVTWSGQFTRREAIGMEKHSGLVCLDLDGVDDLESAAQHAAMCEHVLAVFLSPRGTGLKVLMAVDIGEVATHRHAWEACVAVACEEGWANEDTVDVSGKDVCRLCFLSSDPDAYVAKAVTPLKVDGALADGGAEDTLPEDSDEARLMAMDRRVAGLQLEDARALLGYLDPDCGYEDWIQTGMALKTQFGDDGQELFVEWSSGELWPLGASKYDGGEEVRYKYDSFSAGPVTMRTVMKRAKDAGANVQGLLGALNTVASQDDKRAIMRGDAEMLARSLKEIEDASSIAELEGDVARAVQGRELFDASREKVVEAFQERYKYLSGGKSTITKASCESLLRYNYVAAVAREGCPEWAEGYVFCREKHGLFVNVRSGISHECTSFDRTYASRLITPVMRAQGKMNPYVLPSVLLCNADLVEKVDGVRYRPGEDAIFEDEGGLVCLNTWRRADVQAVPEEDWTEEQAAAVAAWKAHIVWLMGPEHGAMLERFLAYVVQHPGKRCRWAYLMHGPEGCGKTIIVDSLMRCVLGHRNVDVVDGSSLMYTQFNEWQDSRQLCIVEEIYVEGRAKWDVMNALKPAVTNDNLSIHPKGRSKYTTRNVTSWIMSTNHADALPLLADDRRYYIAKTRWQGDEFVADLGGPEKTSRHFRRLCAQARKHGDALLGWLCAVDLSGFETGRASMTREKRALVQASKSDTDVLLDELLEKGIPGVTPMCLELDSLKLAVADAGEAVSGQQLARMLERRGLTHLGRFETGLAKRGTVRSHWYGTPAVAAAVAKKGVAALRNVLQSDLL